MKHLVTFLLLFSSVYGQNTFVYFQNNTHLNFQIAPQLSGNLGSNGSGYTGQSQALQRKIEVLKFSRNIFSSNTYTLTSKISVPGDTILLKIELTSSFTGTTSFKHSLAGPGFSHPWRTNRDIYDQNISLGGQNYILRYQSYSTAPSGIYDDVLLAIYPEIDYNDIQTNNDSLNPDILNVMTYNVYMRPQALFSDDQDIRALHIHKSVKGMDAILFQEVFDNDARPQLLSRLAAEYPYQTTVVDNTSNSLEDGGVLIVSKWPIEVEDQDLWGNNCYQDDCTANKGIKYARINKLGRKYHLFGTHMDAFNDLADVNVRKAQLVQFKTFVDSKNIPANEGIIMGGDFNIDKITNKWGEYDSLWGVFGAMMPTYSGRPASWDSEMNFYLYGISDPVEYLDYVVPRTDHANPISVSNHVLQLRSNHLDMWNIFDLSDHYAIWGRVVYQSLTNTFSDIKNHIKLYPNPSNKFLNVKGLTENCSVEILNVYGQVIEKFEQMNENKPLDISHLSNGMYVLKISIHNESTFLKFMKE